MAAELREIEPNLEGDRWYDAYDIICDYYRLALFNALYCGKRQRWTSAANLGLEISIAILASLAAALTTLKTPIIPVNWTYMLTIVVAVLAAAKPVLKLGDAVARYASHHGQYKDIYLGYQDLVSVIRVERRVTNAAWREHVALSKRYRALAVASDPNPSDKRRRLLKEEVERQIPTASLQI
jgi:hypothetical protein